MPDELYHYRKYEHLLTDDRKSGTFLLADNEHKVIEKITYFVSKNKVYLKIKLTNDDNFIFRVNNRAVVEQIITDKLPWEED